MVSGNGRRIGRMYHKWESLFSHWWSAVSLSSRRTLAHSGFRWSLDLGGEIEDDALEMRWGCLLPVLFSYIHTEQVRSSWLSSLLFAQP